MWYSRELSVWVFAILILFLSCLGLIFGNTSYHSISSQSELDIVWPSGLKLRMVYKEIARAGKHIGLFSFRCLQK